MLRTAQNASSRTRSHRRIRWSIRCAGMYPPSFAAAVHPFAQLAPKNFVNTFPEPATLGYGLLEPDGTTNRSPAMLLANSCTPRFQRRAPGLRVAISSFQAARCGRADGTVRFTSPVPLRPESWLWVALLTPATC